MQQPGGRGEGGGGRDGDGGDKRGNRRQKGEGREKVGGTRGKKQDGKGQEKRTEIEDENSKMRPHIRVIHELTVSKIPPSRAEGR